jgi:hypothetical protein
MIWFEKENFEAIEYHSIWFNIQRLNNSSLVIKMKIYGNFDLIL